MTNVLYRLHFATIYKKKKHLQSIGGARWFKIVIFFNIVDKLNILKFFKNVLTFFF